MQSTEVPASRDFRTAFCEWFNCPPTQFEKKAFWRCLYPHAVPVARLIQLVNPAYFELDLQTLRHIGNASTVAHLLAEVNSFRADYRMRSRFLHDVLRIRISGKRVLRLASKVMR